MTKIVDINGKEKGNITLPKCFSSNIREDIVSKVLESKKHEQPYAPSLLAGLSHSASGILIHRRKVWKSQYGKGMSRIPRKIMSRRGSQFHWEGATSPNTKGGRRAHPPKVVSRISTLKVNKKEMELALKSALTATTDEKIIGRRYSRLEGKKANVPLIVEDKITSLKAKDLISSIKKILGKDLFEVAVQKKAVRTGRGKRRGRKYKSNAGMLLVTGNKEKVKTSAFDVKSVQNVNVTDLAKGGLGRLTMYTESAIKDFEGRFGGKKSK